MATAAQARLETALQRVLDLDCKLRRTGARVTQDKATLDALKAADNELQAASLAAPDTLLPPRLLSALQRALAESCGRRGDKSARMLRCFTAAATVKALLQGFRDNQVCTNQAGCRRQQVRGTRKALHLGCVWHSA
jgi:D-serine deaminase-like pyridoxal phosphate-dependent protein